MGFRGMLLPEADPKETQTLTQHSQVPTCDLKVLTTSYHYQLNRSVT